MTEFFLSVVNMSISASWIVPAVLILRLLLKKAPKWITVLLWGIVAIRLVCPFSIESVMSLIPSTQTVSPEIMMAGTPTIDSGIPIINHIINPMISSSFAPNPVASANPLQILLPVLSVVWLAGIVVLFVYTAISYWRVKRKIRTAVLLRNNIYQSESVVSPFALGIVKPKIYLPFKMNEQDMKHVIAHEQAHIRRKDHLWKLLGFLVLSIHWFNPLMWLGYVLLCRDIEFACDEKVIKELDNGQKADYSQALLTCSVNRRMIAACPLAFGEAGVKNRVNSVLNYKKPAFGIIVAAIIVSIIAAVCFLTNPTAHRLGNIDGHELDSSLNEKTAVQFFDGNEYRYADDAEDEILNELFDIQISRQEVTLSRDEDRDKTNTLLLNLPEAPEQLVMSSYRGGTYIHFNSDFSEVWVNDGVKPTLSYTVKSPDKAKMIFEQIVGNNSISNIDGADSETSSRTPSSPLESVPSGGIPSIFVGAGIRRGLMKNLEPEQQTGRERFRPSRPESQGAETRKSFRFSCRIARCPDWLLLRLLDFHSSRSCLLRRRSKGFLRGRHHPQAVTSTKFPTLSLQFPHPTS
ncbi:MAG: hypothetical protein KH828_11065 [Clostridiales bacterium]|nr:hypothetical protein [Clostridiales bacterium]